MVQSCEFTRYNFVILLSPELFPWETCFDFCVQFFLAFKKWIYFMSIYP